MSDIRGILREAEEPSEELDAVISAALNCTFVHSFSSDYTLSIKRIENEGLDWIMANVNGQVGGTPYACVAVHEDRASYSGTPLLSLWLSYFRLRLGDEREQ